MNSSTLQFVVVGALIAAWAWMLGRPILTNMFRRSRRDSVGHFRYQQAVLGQSMVHDLHTSATPETSPAEMTEFDDAGHSAFADTDLVDADFADTAVIDAPDNRSTRPRPIADWLAQPVERRRLQLMLGFAIATFVSLLMAIALRGSFIRLFLLLAICFVAYVCIAALIGASQLRRAEREFAANYEAPIARASSGAAAITGVPISDQHSLLNTLDSDPKAGSILEGLETYDDLEHFGQGIFDDEFFEPIPELAFQPLDLDEAEFELGDEAEFEDEDEDEVGHQVGDEPAEFRFDYESPFDYAPLSGSDPPEAGPVDPVLTETVLWADLDEPEQVATHQPEQSDFFEHGTAEDDDEFEVEDGRSDNRRMEPTFTAALEQRPRVQKRNKARPIYIESQLDEEAEQTKAVND